MRDYAQPPLSRQVSDVGPAGSSVEEPPGEFPHRTASASLRWSNKEARLALLAFAGQPDWRR